MQNDNKYHNGKKTIIKVRDLTKSFLDGKTEVQILKGVNLDVYEGEFVAIMGRSGAGKSTCMYQLSLLDHPTGGKINILGKDTEKMSNSKRSEFRLYQLGYVFQDFSLIPDLSSQENVALPLMQQGFSKSKAMDMAREALESVNLGHRLKNRPSEMSGGEQQRTAIARAICHKPKILFADEPTANLDLANGTNVIETFKRLNKEGLTIVMVTHEEEYGLITDRIIKLTDGKVVGEDINYHNKIQN